MEKKRKAKWQNDYIAKAYDRIQIVVPKGRKATVEKLAASHNESVNGFVNSLIRNAAGMSEVEWKDCSKE